MSVVATVKVLIVDDEPLARARLRVLLERDASVEVLAEAGSAREAKSFLAQHRPDLIFLDVQMPEGSGFDLLAELGGDRQPVVVFTTAHEEYAVQAFDVNAADYVIKPFDAERVSRALARARRQLAGGAATPARPALARRERFAVRVSGEIIFIRASHIEWISSEGNYSRLHCGEVSYLLRESMQNLDATLDPSRFVRVHRSSIVNVDRVKKLVTTAEGNSMIVLTTGEMVPLGPSYRGRLEQFLGQKL